MNKRQEQAEATKEKIKQTTLRLIKTKNFSDLSVEDITKASGVAKGTFYHYFKKKEDIILLLGLQSFVQLEDSTLRYEEGNINERLRYYFINFMKIIEDQGIELARQWLSYVVVPKLSESKFYKWDTDIAAIEKILRDGIDQHELAKNTPVDVIANILGTELYGMVSVWCMTDSEFVPSEWTGRFCDIQLPQLLKPYLIER
ncbi:TetR/AcrR family transcriptional regulator [Companilactobacillus baiquanensis]|uniref:TetR/AcrR family transcriptional regulator n=1 Tax=Companilactobacillus baiquanensis TaxID=2486005 RepID=A0ABW1US19_9LACO|nr:TetR/AcrR family transcriptional regulator [Companilactobacillus baiquanensis]